MLKDSADKISGADKSKSRRGQGSEEALKAATRRDPRGG